MCSIHFASMPIIGISDKTSNKPSMAKDATINAAMPKAIPTLPQNPSLVLPMIIPFLITDSFSGVSGWNPEIPESNLLIE